MEAEPALNLVGRTFGHYEILSRLAAGGMGVVWKARHQSLGTVVALKTLPEGFQSIPVLVERFRREAQVMAKLNHPNIVRVTDFGNEGDIYYFVMELVEGRTLSDQLRESGPLPIQEALRILRDIAAGVDRAHAQGVIHRDLKPSNVMIAGDGTVKVTDFGLARIMEGVVQTKGGKLRTASEAARTLGQQLTASERDESLGEEATGSGLSPDQLSVSGQILGTLEYMSPEQRAGEPVDARTDVYALAVMTFEMLIGHRPRGIEYPHELREEIGPAVTKVLHQALGPPDRRPASAGAFVGALGAALGQAPAAAEKRSSPVLGIVGVAVLVLIAGGGIWWWKFRPAPVPERQVQPAKVQPEAPLGSFTLRFEVLPDDSGTIRRDKPGPNYEEGVEVTLTAAPAAGYRFEKWWDGDRRPTRRLTVTSDRTVSASFRRTALSVRIRAQPEAAGRVEVDPKGATFEHGRTLTLTAVPAEGFEFVSWTDDPEQPPTRRITIEGPLDLVAQFRQRRFRLTVEPSPDRGGSVLVEPQENSYAVGTEVTLTARPAGGFEFVGWDDGVEETVRSFAIREDRSLKARFVRQSVRVGALASPKDGGTVELSPRGPRLEHGATVRLSARAAPGYVFAGWKDGGGKSSRTERIMSDRTFVAIFKDGSRVLEGHTGTIWELDFTPDGRHLVSASADKTVRVWDLQTRQVVTTFKGHKYRPVTAVAVSPDGEWVASGGEERDAKIWKLKSGKMVYTVYPHGNVRALAWAKGRDFLATGAATKFVGLWDIKNRVIMNNRMPLITLAQHGFEVNAIAFNPKGTIVATGSGDGGVRLFDVNWGRKKNWPSRAEMLALPNGEARRPSHFIAWTADGAWLAARWAKDPKKIAVWDATRWGEPARFLEGHTAAVTAVAASAKGDLIAGAAEDGTVRLWNAVKGTLLGTIRGHEGAVNTVKFHPGGGWIGTAGEDKAIRLVPLGDVGQP